MFWVHTNMQTGHKKQAVDTSRVTYTTTPEVMSSVAAAYENNIMGAMGIL